MTWAAIGHALSVFTVMVSSMAAMWRMASKVTSAYVKQMEAAQAQTAALNVALDAARQVDAAVADVSLRSQMAYQALADIAVTRRALAVPVLLPLALDVLRLEWTGGRYVDPAPRFDRPAAPPRAIELD